MKNDSDSKVDREKVRLILYDFSMSSCWSQSHYKLRPTTHNQGASVSPITGDDHLKLKGAFTLQRLYQHRWEAIKVGPNVAIISTYVQIVVKIDKLLQLVQ